MGEPRPAPWRWAIEGGAATLEDASGERVSTSESYVAELVRAAPEMADLLRDYLTLSAATFGHENGHEGCEVCLHCANAKILARIDAAADAGKAKGG